MVSKFQIQGRKTSLSIAGIHGSQDVKTEIVPIAVSAHEKSKRSATVQFYLHEKLMLGDQIGCGAARIERPLPTSEELAE